MSRSDRRGFDTTSETVIGDMAGSALITAISQRIADDVGRKVLFANITLGISLANLEAQVGIHRKELAERIDANLALLREDAQLMEELSGIKRAGRDEHFQAMIIQLKLEDWFCAYCGQFMIQPSTGRPRRTCTDLCRHRLWRLP